MKHKAHKPITVWSTNALPLVPDRYKSLYTIVLPGVYIGLVLFGVSSFFVGSKIITDFTVAWFSPAWAITTFVGACLSLIGLVFIKERAEMLGEFIVGIGLLIYMASTVLYMFGGSPTAVLTLIFTGLRLVTVVWRVNDLVGELARKGAVHG
jgi:hypothetical protein